MICNSLNGDKEVCKSLEEFLFEMKEWCKQTEEWTDREDENQSRSIQTRFRGATPHIIFFLKLQTCYST
jgi:hypothetical protein